MHHPSLLCNANVPCTLSALCMKTLVPGSANGVLLYLKTPFSIVSAKILGLICNWRKRLSVVTALRMSQSHICIGKSGLMLANPAKKWSFNVDIALLAAFDLCRCDGTSRKLMLFFWKCSFNASEHSLWRIYNYGLNPRSVMYLCSFACAVTIVFASLFRRGSTKMALVSWSYSTTRYLLPLLEVTEKRPIWLLYTLLVISITFIDIALGWTGSVVIPQCWLLSVSSVSVPDLIFCKSCFKWPCIVAGDFGRCFLTSSSVKPGHVV